MTSAKVFTSRQLLEKHKRFSTVWAAFSDEKTKN